MWLLVSTTKSTDQPFSTPMFVPSSLGGLIANLQGLTRVNGGMYRRGHLNSLIYSGLTATLATLISTLAGYAPTKYEFKLGRTASFMVLVAPLLPGATLAIPVLLLLKSLGLMDTYLAVILPMVVLFPFLRRFIAAGLRPEA